MIILIHHKEEYQRLQLILPERSKILMLVWPSSMSGKKKESLKAKQIFPQLIRKRLCSNKFNFKKLIKEIAMIFTKLEKLRKMRKKKTAFIKWKIKCQKDKVPLQKETRVLLKRFNKRIVIFKRPC